MALTIDEIAQTLDNMRSENEDNIKELERVLAGINSKIDLMSENDETVDLIRIYISELKNAIESKNADFIDRIDSLETSIEKINAAQDLYVKDEKLDKVFANLQSEVSEYESLIKDNKDILDKLYEKFDTTITSKNFDEFRSDLADFVQKIIDNSSVLNSELAHNSEKIDNILDNLESSDYKERFDGISSKIDSVQDVLSENSMNNFSNIKGMLEKLSEAVNEQQKIYELSASQSEQDRKDFVKNISENLKDIENVIAANIESFKYNVNENILGIKDFVTEVGHSTNSLYSESEKKLTSKLESIEILNNAFEVSLNSVHSELKGVIDAIDSLNIEGYSQELKNEILNTVSAANLILSAIHDLNAKNAELDKKIAEILNDSLIKENCSDILNKLDVLISHIDYSSDFTKLSSKLDVIEDGVNASKSISADLNSKVESFGEVLQDVKDFVNDSVSEGKEILNAQLVKFEDMFSKVVSEEDFKNFRLDFADFIQKILDNAHALHLNYDTTREQIALILEKISSFENVEQLEEILKGVSDVKQLFENCSKENCENILSEIDNVRDEIKSSISENEVVSREILEKVNIGLVDIAENIQIVKEWSSNGIFEAIDRISKEVNVIKDDLSDKLDSNFGLNSDDLKVSIANVMSEISDLKNEIVEKTDSNIYNVSTEFESVKASLENILSVFNSLSDDFNNVSSGNYSNLTSQIADLSDKLEYAKDEINKVSENCLESILEKTSLVENKMDLISDTLSEKVLENFESLKTMFSEFLDNLNVSREDYINQFKDLGEKNAEELKNISENVSSFRLCINDVQTSIQNYIGELNEGIKTSNSDLQKKVSEKLVDLESTFIQNSQDYEQRMEVLQGKLSEFVQIVENSTSDTEAKIAVSMNEVGGLREELTLISEALKSAKITADQKFTETVSVIDNGIERIVSNIEEVNSSVFNNIESGVKENLGAVEEKFNSLLDSIETLKNENNSEVLDSFIQSVDDKISSLKQEFGLVNTDIANALQAKSDEISRAFDGFKSYVDEFVGADFNKVIADLKAQIEKSFMNLSVDLNGELAAGSESILRLEQAYKEIFNKISLIEECVCERIQNDIELFNATFEKNICNIKDLMESKVDDSLENLRNHLEIALHNLNVSDAVNSMAVKLDEISSSQNSLLEQNNVISANISVLGDNIKNYVQTACENTIDKFSPQENKELLDALNAKIDLFVSSDVASETLDAIDSLNSSNEVISGKIGDGFKDLSEKFDGFAEDEAKISQMLSALHEKVDVLAMDGAEFDIIEEIDDIKDLIFEQRKYFEATSDEKTAAIDKYLRDLLLKLDGIDLEKNSEDIKESIMNALVSLFDQISFVEETEEIKDFVEEKTDEIKQNLLQVQTQLHQLASSGDDFEYSYTLQDVESDIAKLRLAMNNMSSSGSDFESLSDDIKRIVNSVEGLESSLTQEQIVDLKSDIEKLSDDILSISSRTNKLLLTSDESYKALNDGLNNFSSLVYKLEERISDLDNTQFSERIENKLDSIHSMAVASGNADKVFHQVMMYLGEWIDSSSENISEISTIKAEIEELKNAMPDKSQLLDNLEEKFERQEERIDRLEMKLEKILSTLEQKDDMVLNRKVDKIEKMLSRLGSNIEKLASYVDEE